MSGKSSDSDSSSVEDLLFQFYNSKNEEKREQGQTLNQDPGPSVLSNQKIRASTSGSGNETANDTLRGMKRQSARQRCTVCGDEASGVHYGVLSCESCKAFFRRCVYAELPDMCKMDQKCPIDRFNRNICQGCWFDKCILAGMRRDVRCAQCDSDEEGEYKCAICTGKASNVFYGALACNACNSFFRWTVLSNVRYTCKKGGKCPVTVCHEEYCESCRYDKCIDVGMKRSLVQNWGYAPESEDQTCAVWGDYASSFPCRSRAPVCRACERFSQRCMQDGGHFTCNNDQKCSVNVNNRRSSCRSCRFGKCIEIGMRINLDIAD